ncbi:DUF4224 domain-containing protein [Castellaniella hirudinis]|uniref:DUF4224 domain-containing protein n=1 Tax=Castellaniella hirudinis TaxID=1144617 RepID=UPI0039C23EA9
MLICTQEDVEQITGKTKFKAQLRALREMGIPHMARSTDGSPLVAVAVVEAMLGVKVSNRGTAAPQLRRPAALRGSGHEATQKG